MGGWRKEESFSDYIVLYVLGIIVANDPKVIILVWQEQNLYIHWCLFQTTKYLFRHTEVSRRRTNGRNSLQYIIPPF